MQFNPDKNFLVMVVIIPFAWIIMIIKALYYIPIFIIGKINSSLDEDFEIPKEEDK